MGGHGLDAKREGWLGKLFGEDKTSIRFGAGMYYQNFGPELAQNYSASGEYGVSTTVSNPAHRSSLNNSPRVGSSLADMNIIPLQLLSRFGVLPPSSISKQWRIPHAESHTFELRWSVFNAFNNTKFNVYAMQDEWDVPSTFGNQANTLTTPRFMEFAGIYRF